MYRLRPLGGGVSIIGGNKPETAYLKTFVAGSNITLTPSANTITIASTGGGGGSTVVSAISSPTNAAATAGTTYVYLVSGTTTLTLPTAVGNTSLYHVKRTGVNTVTIATTSAQTIDGSQPITLTTQYQSYSIISDGANWNIL